MRFGVTEAVTEDWSLDDPQEAEKSKHREEQEDRSTDTVVM